jgi:hypothetical protein
MDRLLVVCFLVSVASGLGAPAGEPAREETALPALLREALDKESLSYRLLDLVGGEPENVSPDRVPPEVREKADQWIRRILRPEWVPEASKMRLEALIRQVEVIPPERIGFLWAEYPVAGGRLKLNEGLGCVAVLWANKNVDLGPDPSKTAVLLTKRFLDIPEDSSKSLEASLHRVEARGTELYVGTLVVKAHLRVEHPMWYDRMSVWLAPGFFYLAVPENAGEAGTTAHVGGHARFLPPQKPDETRPPDKTGTKPPADTPKEHGQ